MTIVGLVDIGPQPVPVVQRLAERRLRRGKAEFPCAVEAHDEPREAGARRQMPSKTIRGWLPSKAATACTFGERTSFLAQWLRPGSLSQTLRRNVPPSKLRAITSAAGLEGAIGLS